MTLHCNRCGSKRLIRYGKRWHRVAGRMVKNAQQYRCNNCGRVTWYPTKRDD